MKPVAVESRIEITLDFQEIIYPETTSPKISLATIAASLIVMTAEGVTSAIDNTSVASLVALAQHCFQEDPHLERAVSAQALGSGSYNFLPPTAFAEPTKGTPAIDLTKSPSPEQTETRRSRFNL